MIIAFAVLWLAFGAWAIRFLVNELGMKLLTRSFHDKFMLGVCLLLGPITWVIVLVVGRSHGASFRNLFR